MIDKLDILIVKSIIETTTLKGQTFSASNTEVMPNMFKCSNSSWIITGVSTYTLRLKVWQISSGDIIPKGIIEIDGPISIADLKTKIEALMV